MSKQDLESAKAARKCASTRGADKKCDTGCIWDPRKGCIPEKEEKDSTGKFMDGSRYLTFRSNKKPAFSFRIPVNEATLFGEYRGAIRWSPATGKLHLCYGPIIDPENGTPSDRPLLNMLVRDKVGRDVWEWYENSGRALQKKRVRETAESDPLVYAEIYGLPGASMQLSWAECMYLDKAIDEAGHGKSTGPKSLGDLATAPNECPPFLGSEAINDCFSDNEYGDFWNEKAGKAKERRGKDYDYNPYKTAGKEKQKYLIDDEEEQKDDEGGACKDKKKMERVMRKGINLSSPLAKSFGKTLEDQPNILVKSLQTVQRPTRTARESANGRPKGADPSSLGSNKPSTTLTPEDIFTAKPASADFTSAYIRAEKALLDVAQEIFKANEASLPANIDEAFPADGSSEIAAVLKKEYNLQEDARFVAPIIAALKSKSSLTNASPKKVAYDNNTLKMIFEACKTNAFDTKDKFTQAVEKMPSQQYQTDDNKYGAYVNDALLERFGKAIVYGVKIDMLREIARIKFGLDSSDSLLTRNMNVNFEEMFRNGRGPVSRLRATGRGIFGKNSDWEEKMQEIVGRNSSLANVFSATSIHRSERNLRYRNRNSRYSSSQSESSDYSDDY